MKSLSHCSENKTLLLYFSAAAVFFLSIVISLFMGSTKLSLNDISGAFSGGTLSPGERIFLYVRIPRTAACVLAGTALASAGAVIQNVLANKLASPGIIGVNSGAGLAVTACTALGIYSGWPLFSMAFLGAFLAVMLLCAIAGRWGASRGTVILIGAALNSLFNAFSDAIISFNPEVGLTSGDFKIGTFSGITYQKIFPAAVIVILSLIILLTLSNEQDILTLGDDTAKGLGLDSKKMRVFFLALAAALSGAAVSLAGLLSFVGLMVPHAVRRLGAYSSKHLVPLSALFGAGFVALSDTVARTAFSPYEIPVGIIMAFLGAPFFLFLLISGRGGH